MMKSRTAAVALVAISLAAAASGIGTVAGLTQTSTPHHEIRQATMVKTRGSGNRLVVPGALRNAPEGDTRTPAPAAKASGKANQLPICEVIFDNFVNLMVAVAIDDKLVGLVPPYGQLDATARPGTRTLEGLAEYSDGTMGQFGPQSVTCPAGSGVRFELRP
jgi:hypothetical protein